jgi:small subunit ribosomal protein S9
MAEEQNDTQAQTPETSVATEEKPATEVRAAKLPDPPAQKHFFWGTARRKKSIARVRIRPGSGEFIVNKRKADEYFTEDRDRNDILAPLQAAGMTGRWDVFVNVQGGGFTGQAGAIVLGLSRALCEAVPDIEIDLRHKNLLTRDARMKERKKYGQPGARKRFQFSKR